jgi:hypothetical protein
MQLGWMLPQQTLELIPVLAMSLYTLLLTFRASDNPVVVHKGGAMEVCVVWAEKRGANVLNNCDTNSKLRKAHSQPDLFLINLRLVAHFLYLFADHLLQQRISTVSAEQVRTWSFKSTQFLSQAFGGGETVVPDRTQADTKMMVPGELSQTVDQASCPW